MVKRPGTEISVYPDPLLFWVLVFLDVILLLIGGW